jgi:hypothetical protein
MKVVAGNAVARGTGAADAVTGAADAVDAAAGGGELAAAPQAGKGLRTMPALTPTPSPAPLTPRERETGAADAVTGAWAGCCPSSGGGGEGDACADALASQRLAAGSWLLHIPGAAVHVWMETADGCRRFLEFPELHPVRPNQ